MHARSALFDLYGDHLLARGGSAPVAGLIRMLEPLGISGPAVRTAVSRMVAQGWLEPEDGGAVYRATERARVRLDEAGARIYRTGTENWDGCWHLRILDPIADRGRRERVRTQLRFHGLAPVNESTWVTPRHSAEADRLLAEEQVAAVALSSTDAGPPQRLLAAYDVDALAAAYDDWRNDAVRRTADAPARGDDRTAFVVRSELVHSWRMFLFRDPGLPTALLPADWPGYTAAAFFDEHADRLLPAARRFVDGCLSATLASTGTTPTNGASR
ncbi:MAG: PaaX family transcriptional regulator [Nocardioidaceae bacterium]|nr:PaaX family transcriptional regulator [Nocardioidaceae bacterium]